MLAVVVSRVTVTAAVAAVVLTAMLACGCTTMTMCSHTGSGVSLSRVLRGSSRENTDVVQVCVCVLLWERQEREGRESLKRRRMDCAREEMTLK